MRNVIYILTKLFNVNDRKASLRLNNIICRWIEEGELSSFEKCFLPYRDSNDQVKNLKNKTFEIFKMDCQTIKNAKILVGYCDGPSYDSGIGFEIGYAATRNIRAILLTTDYFYIETENQFYSISPLAEKIANIIHIRENPEFIGNYEEGLYDIENRLLKKLQKGLMTVEEPERNILEVIEMSCQKHVYIDYSFCLNEIRRGSLVELENFLKKNNISYYIASETDVDINLGYLMKCNLVLIWADEFDFYFDSAITQGIAYGWEKRILLYSSTKIKYFQLHDFILYKNPMIEYSAQLISNKEQLYKEILSGSDAKRNRGGNKKC